MDITSFPCDFFHSCDRYPSDLELHIIFSLICCTVHAVPHQVTFETIPVDVLCEVWELFDHVEYLMCERVSEPQQVCHVQF